MRRTEEELTLIILEREVEKAVDEHINKQAKELGYDNINSIAKYLVEGNPFKAECETLSLWSASCWVTVHAIQSDVEVGLRTVPTVYQVIDELPVYG